MTFENWIEYIQTTLGTYETEVAKAAWIAATNAEYERCMKVCEDAEDTGNATGIERDVHLWNLAVKHCLNNIRKCSNVELRGRPLAGGPA